MNSGGNPSHGTPLANRVPRQLAVALIDAYKRWLSPLLPRSCRFSPTCSEYARLAIRKHGLWRGGVATIGRLGRCNPMATGGIDIP